MKVIAVVSAKGGVGKTTTASNLSHALVRTGVNVLAMDLDPQNALRLHLGMRPGSMSGFARSVLAHEKLDKAIFHSPTGVYVLPYGALNEEDRSDLEAQMEANSNWLYEQLQSLNLGETDIVVLDTPPGPSVYLRHALSFAQMALVVMLTDAASYATLPMMSSLLTTYAVGRSDFIDYAIILNQVDNIKQLSKDVAQVLQLKFGDRVACVIHQDQAVSEALAFDKSVLDYEPYCQATHDFMTCAQWVRQCLGV